ncbi:SRPBCC family protein [Actinomadura harenae]|uniref:SRPBCC family protein n=1 Tax=Actinomadura harenae TaxID=2483351 RepID=A0A3M2M9H5_9ACTN|nr:SRPBCC family protein [Actinomadura harenae]RMI46122.1 hypothetical protein EBO15_07830 [Actinomadura harenae]
MYEISAEAVITGDIETVWDTVCDVAGWPAWDPHEKDARLDGPFEAGTIGWSKPNGGPSTDWTITEVVPFERWGSECGLPGGKITGMNEFEPLPGGRIRCTKTMRVSGPLVPLFRFYFGRRVRADMFKTFTALEAEAARRGARAA